MIALDDLVYRAAQLGASDLHLIKGLPPKMRLDGGLIDMEEERLTAEDCHQIASELAAEAYEDLMERGEYDGAKTIAGNRCRIHLFKQSGTPSLALRILKQQIPAFAELGLPAAAADFAHYHKGIVLITGETGSGKSTTLAALIDTINHTYRRHIVTLEDPIEYQYEPDLCAINQRQVGSDTASFAEGLRASLREDPDVILIGEMRDRDTIETAITAAETGHLVFGTLHTGSTADAVDRIVQVFPGEMQPQIRMQLSTTLMAVMTQQLVPRPGGGRVPACEVMIVTDAIRNLIRSGNTPQIANAVATSASIGGQSMDQALIHLYREGQITGQQAVVYAHNLEYVKKNCGRM